MSSRLMKVTKPLVIGTLVLSILVISSGMALAAEPQPSVFPSDQLPPDSFVPGEFLVKFKSGISQQIIDRFNSRFGVTELKDDPWGLMRMALPKSKSFWEVLAAYSRNPDVEYVEPNTICRATMTPTDYFYSLQWNLDNSVTGGIHMEKAWDLANGSGVVVAVLDTGIAYENYDQNGDGALDFWLAPDLARTRFVPGYDFINNDAHANDDNSHGTHVAGTIAQSTNNANPGSAKAEGTAGIAYGATLMPVKVLDGNGTGSAYSLSQGIRYAADHGAKVINMSLAWPFFFGYPMDAGRSVRDAVTYAYSKGVTLVAAASNDGRGYVAYPAAYPECIAVGATQYDENPTPYTNWGSALDLMAPGGNSSLDQNGDGYGDGILQQTFNPNTKDRSDFWYWFFGGTSMASPHVAGVAALVISAGVTDPAAVKQVLYSTAEDHGTSGWDSRYGWGIVDAYAALASLGPANQAPVASSQSITTPEDTPQAVVLSGIDGDGDPKTYTVVSLPAHGSLAGIPPNITYSPAANYNGADSFTFKVNDGMVDSNIATVSITVTEVNDPPIAQTDSLTAYQNTPLSVPVSSLLSNDSPGPANEGGQVLNMTSLGTAASGNVTLSGGTITYTPKLNYVGSDGFTYTIQDNGTSGGGGDSKSATGVVSVTVAPVNHAPVAGSQAVTTAEDTAAAVTLTGSDSDGDLLTYGVTTGPAHGRLTGTAPSLSYIPNTNYNGPDSFVFKANDGKLDSNLATVSITVASVNDPPLANSGGPYSGVQGDIINFNGSASSDVDGDTLSYAWNFGDGATGTGVSPTHAYVSAGNYNVTLTVNDGWVNSVTSMTVVTIDTRTTTADLNITLSKQTFWAWYWWVNATVSVSSSGLPLAGATLYGTWSGAYNAQVSATIGTNGIASFRSSFAAGYGSMRLTITRVVKDGREYTLSGETSDLMNGP